MQNNRWWEAYLTRFLIGSIVGAACLFAIIHPSYSNCFGNKVNEFICYTLGNKNICSGGENCASTNSDKCKKEYESQKPVEDMSRLILLLVFGFAYCYVVSAPLALMHYLRASLLIIDSNKFRSNNEESVLSRFNFVSIIFYILIPGSLILSVKSQFCMFFGLILVALLATIEVSFPFSGAYSFYVKKALIFTSSNNGWPREFASSYKHLAEHGNAYLIVIYEILFAVALTSSELSFINGMWLIILWVFLGAICLVYAKQLEIQMVHTTPASPRAIR
jgi:hypothetical protein